MPIFSNASGAKLLTVHPDLQAIFFRVIRDVDCIVLSGRRTTAEQQALYAQGRTKPGNIVTYLDGTNKLSNHQRTVHIAGHDWGLAVDVAPYPIDWNDTRRFREFGQYVLGVAAGMGYRVEWGGNWKMQDLPHFELILD